MAAKALEANIASSRVDVRIDRRYEVLPEVMEKYIGLQKGLRTLLEELCHPYKNWGFIVKEARGFALNYFHALKDHPKGPDAFKLYVDIFFQAIDSSQDTEVRIGAADNLLVYMQRVMKDAGEDLSRFLPVLDYAFDRIRSYPEDIFLLFVQSFYPLDKLGKIYAETVSNGWNFSPIIRLLVAYYRFTYGLWLAEEDPLVRFEKESGVSAKERGLTNIFRPVSQTQLRTRAKALEGVVRSKDLKSKKALERLVRMPGYGKIVAFYAEIPQMLSASGKSQIEGSEWRLIFLLQIMGIEGLAAIHEETLRDINRTLARLIREESPHVIQQMLEKTFAILRTSKAKFPVTALNCIVNVGRAVYKTDDSDLVDYFMESAISLGFQSPQIRGVGDDWQIRANTAHIQNIRTWLELIELNPKWSKKLLSSLTVHLCLGGVFIKDTDLFPRDITRLLNSHIQPIYNLVKQLARLFPAYFNDIGSEGRLRDISTRIDEISLRKDVLVHFIRKQSHVESSNETVKLLEATLEFWRTKDKTKVHSLVPKSIYDQIETEGPYVDGVHDILTHLHRKMEFRGWTDWLRVEEGELALLIEGAPAASALDRERVRLAVTFYKLLRQKYDLAFTQIESQMPQLKKGGLPELHRLEAALAEKESKGKLVGLLGHLEVLKEIILSGDVYEMREDIYRKRHFTVDIPSMYGSYHEMKFDALGLTFRLESLVNVLFENMVETIDLDLITRAKFSQIYDDLRLFDRALRLDGITSLEMARQLELLAHALDMRGFSATQYLDIFRGFSQAVGNIVNDYFNNIHQKNLHNIFDQMSSENLMPKYVPKHGEVDRERLGHRVTEIFLRDRIASSLGLQQLDVFLSRILMTLHNQSNELPEERLRLLLSYDPQKALTCISPAKEEVLDIIHLGNKGLNLVRIKDYGLPVPPGFIVTTEVFRCREIVENYSPARKNFQEQVAREVSALERATGKSFGDPACPLLLSVRSGSSVSQPGMMNTFLDVGINEAVAEGMKSLTGNAWFAWDTYRRFLQSYGMAFGVKRDAFDEIISDFKIRFGVPFKKDFTGEQMRDIALTYKSLIIDNGIEMVESALEQLHTAIQKVFDSWKAPKAEAYRKIMGISDDWGTAVTVQAMVFGNRSREAGSGVFFTHSPRWSGDMLVLWGDFTYGNQGEDVVSGLVRTFPISLRQAEVENREGATALEVALPGIYKTMREWAKGLVYGEKWSPQEMEFTFEGPDPKDLYFLQARDMAVRERKAAYAFDPAQERPPKRLGHGIGVSGGAMAGRIVFTLEDIRKWREKEPETSLIVARNDTVPDDILEIYEADGLLTGRGGPTSHAAIVAHRLGKTCIVGCSNFACIEKERTCVINQKHLKTGEWISIDGVEGSVYSGQLKISYTESA